MLTSGCAPLSTGVLRALHMLTDERLMEFRRGRGIAVTGTPQRGAVLTQVRRLIEFARERGHGRGAHPDDHRPARRYLKLKSLGQVLG